MNVRMVPLGEVCVQDRRTIQPDDPEARRLPYIGVEHVVSGSGALDLSSQSRIGDGKSVAFRFDDQHVLYAKLRPYLNKVALPTSPGRSSTELVPLRPVAGVDREYLAHVLRRPETVRHVMASVTGARMPRTDMSILMAMPIPLPPLEEPRRIVDILNRAASIRRLRDQANATLRALIPALFIKMFGDPAENPMGWDVRPLGDIGQVQGGLQVTKKRDVLPLEQPYLRVANVLRDQLVLDEIKTIRITSAELERVRLRKGDLLVVEGHGNPNEVGRVAIWDGSIENCVHQNHLIRVRIDGTTPMPEYACAFLNSASGRAHLVGSGKTTSGLNTISASEVRRCPIMVPPTARQRSFVSIVESLRAAHRTGKLATTVGEDLSAALLARLLGEAR